MITCDATWAAIELSRVDSVSSRIAWQTKTVEGRVSLFTSCEETDHEKCKQVAHRIVGSALGCCFSTQAVAQDTPARDAAIARCVKQAQTMYPDDGDDQGRNCTMLYKSCMTTAGFNP